MRVGILTGGGDCPGLNAVIRAAVRKGIFHHNDEFVGFIEGWRGVVENKTMPLTIDTVSGILQLGGTILRTSRTNPRKMEGGIEKCLASLKANQLDALITIGGDDTQGVANALVQKGIKVVGVPKTIDNDLSGTDACFGFDTAVSIATEAVEEPVAFHCRSSQSSDRVRGDGPGCRLDCDHLRHRRRRRRNLCAGKTD